jgi:prepilin-type N-terminal cleavage/methylation domain-containing protein
MARQLFIMVMSFSTQRSRRAGFTLIEVLVVMAIVVVLAALVFVVTRKTMAGAYKSRNVSQMREIGTAVAMWASEHNNNEPMYFANGTGDFGHEGRITGKNPLLSPGNPAKLLYNKDDPSSSYLPSHTVWFSPLCTFEAPDAADYDPDNASGSLPWGNFVWLYPSTATITPRQRDAMGGFSNGTIGREAAGNVIMGNNFDPAFHFAKPRYSESYHALFRDGSVKYIGDTAQKWRDWYTGKND